MIEKQKLAQQEAFEKHKQKVQEEEAKKAEEAASNQDLPSGNRINF